MGIDGADIKRTRIALEKRNKAISDNFLDCRTCAKQISKIAPICPHCGDPQREYAATPASDKNAIYSRVCAYAGAGLLVIGSFCPVISAPIIGDINMFQNGEGDGVALLIFATLSVVFTFFGKLRYLFYTAAGGAIILGFDFYHFRQKMAEFADQTATDFSGNHLASGIADMAIRSVQMQWGWGVLIVACALLFSAALLSENAIDA